MERGPWIYREVVEMGQGLKGGVEPPVDTDFSLTRVAELEVDVPGIWEGGDDSGDMIVMGRATKAEDGNGGDAVF